MKPDTGQLKDKHKRILYRPRRSGELTEAVEYLRRNPNCKMIIPDAVRKDELVRIYMVNPDQLCIANSLADIPLQMFAPSKKRKGKKDPNRPRYKPWKGKKK